jgi:hypothetical protein
VKTRRLPTRSVPTSASGAPARPGGGVVLPFRRPVDHEPAPSSTWDELTKLALDGWCWRDPESLARIEACVQRLWVEVEGEWGEQYAIDPITRPA